MKETLKKLGKFVLVFLLVLLALSLIHSATGANFSSGEFLIIALAVFVLVIGIGRWRHSHRAAR